MGYGLIIAGIAFLFVPSFGLYDIMPDVIGYLLIVAGLSKLSQLNGDLQSSRRNFRYLLYISLAKLILTLPVLNINDETTTMLLVFAFAIAETVFLLPAFSELCEGSYYLSSRSGCDVPDRSADDLRLFSRIFVIARAVLVTGPELTVLTNNAYKESVTVDDLEKPTLYDSKSVLTIACFVISFLIGAVFFVLALRYFGRLRKDAGFVAVMRQRYAEEIEGDDAKQAYAAVRSCTALVTVACVFLAGVHFYGFDVLPDLVAAALLSAVFYKLRRITGTKPAMRASIVTAVICAVSFAAEYYIARAYFNGSYEATASTGGPYMIAAACRAVCFVLFAWLFYKLSAYLCRAVDGYTKAPTFDEEAYKKGLYIKCRTVGVAGIAACGISAAAGFLTLYNGLFRFAGAAVFIVCAVICFVNMNRLCDELSRRL